MLTPCAKATEALRENGKPSAAAHDDRLGRGESGE